MSILNAALRSVFDLLLYPFRELPLIVGLIIVSAATAIGMLVVFKVTSDQPKIAAVKRRIHACLFEIRLFNDDLRAILRAQVEILRHNLSYLRLSLVPLLWMIVPLTLVLAQLNFHYAYQGLTPGQTAVVKVALKSTAPGAQGRDTSSARAKPDVVLEAPEGIRVETRPVWMPSSRELAWRIAAERPGDYELKLRLDGNIDTKEVRVSDAVVRRSPVRVGTGLLDQFLNPAEAPLPDTSPFSAISISYDDRDLEIFGWGLHWMIPFFAFSLLFAFLLRHRFGVTI